MMNQNHSHKISPVNILRRGLLRQTVDPDAPEVRLFTEILVSAVPSIMVDVNRARKENKRAAARAKRVSGVNVEVVLVDEYPLTDAEVARRHEDYHFITSDNNHDICHTIGIEPEFYRKGALNTLRAMIGG